MKISYSTDQRARAKAEKLHLITLEINGHPAGEWKQTYQGLLFTDEQVQKAKEFFGWLAASVARAQEGSEAKPQ